MLAVAGGTFDPWTSASLALGAGLFLWASHRVPAFPLRKKISILLGLAIAWVAVATPIAAYAHRHFSLHMLQHLLLTLAAAPLLVLGAPVALALRAVRAGMRRRLISVLHSPPVRLAAQPVVAWLAFAAVMWGTHFSGFYDLALESDVVHLVEHALYLLVAAAFWWPLAGVDPGARRLGWPARVLYLLLAVPLHAFLGLALYSAGQPLYSHYSGHFASVAAALDDQRAGALIMWIGGHFVFLAALAALVFGWMRYEGRKNVGAPARRPRRAS